MPELSLLRLQPDRSAWALWAARQRQPRGVLDEGFVWHGLLQAVFGEHAPKPFVDRLAAGSNELLGYAPVSEPLPDIEPLAARAAGLDRLRSTVMPQQWQAGRLLSFEVRARPVVRSRQGDKDARPIELDAAAAARRHDPVLPREVAYRHWLARELSRGGAAELGGMRLAAFARTRVARRQGTPGERGWSPSKLEGPDAWFRGTLKVTDGDAFAALLARGIGRHRSFGFGCLLIAPAGVLE
ncbi:hypothetical protein MASR1M8_01190 [Thermomonas brevis]